MCIGIGLLSGKHAMNMLGRRAGPAADLSTLSTPMMLTEEAANNVAGDQRLAHDQPRRHEQ